jgi:hypothetical protein
MLNVLDLPSDTHFNNAHFTKHSLRKIHIVLNFFEGIMLFCKHYHNVNKLECRMITQLNNTHAKSSLKLEQGSL